MRILLLLILCVSCNSQEKRTFVTRHYHERPLTHCYPHVSGELLRLFADHVVDDTRQPFNPKSVQEGDLIFLKTKYLKKFLKYMHPNIAAPYILITGNGDEEAPGVFHQLLDDPKLIHWYAMNATLAHPKLTPIPIGAGSMRPSQKEALIHTLLESPQSKETLLYLNFRPDNHPERALALDYFTKQPFCFVDTSCPQDVFLQRVAQSKYVVCPRGNGLDTHRVWEALLLGSIPILKSNALDPLYADLPVLIVQEWSDVTQELLNTHYEKLKNGSYKLEKLTAAYWLKEIAPKKFDEEKLKAQSYVDSDSSRLNMLLKIQA